MLRYRIQDHLIHRYMILDKNIGKKKIYYYRIRSYIKKGRKIVYGKWSKTVKKTSI